MPERDRRATDDGPNDANGEVRYTYKELLAEIREGIHAIKSVNAAHELRLSQLEADVGGLKVDRATYVPIVEKIVRELDVAAAVHDAFEKREDRGFTRRQKLALLAFGLVQILVAIAALVVSVT